MTAESLLDGRVTLLVGDCWDELPSLKADSIDACVCDPPYHLTSIVKRFGQASAGGVSKIEQDAAAGATPFGRGASGFMGKRWDGGDIAFQPALWAEVLRVLKPGAYLVAFSSTRTFGRMSVAIEDAGFIVHPFVAWLFGQGFPKAHRITHSGLSSLDRETEGWDGWHYGGQTLKPAIEPIFMGQKPFAPGLTGSQNVQRYGVGALNIDGCRVDAPDGLSSGGVNRHEGTGWGFGDVRSTPHNLGRWPANVIHDGSDEVVEAFPESNARDGDDKGIKKQVNVYGNGWSDEPGASAGRRDTGSAARFFYTAKADSDDRLGSKHPTVKPLDLIQWLVRLVTPPGGAVLDLFAGTGTTGEACYREGARAVLIERESEYQADIRRRMQLCAAGPTMRALESAKAKNADKTKDDGPLFA